MEFYDFLGNTSMKSRLSETFDMDKATHCYLISGPEGSGKHTLSKLLAAAFQCTSSSARPCRVCPQCRKIFADNHPDLVTVDEPSKKIIPVEQIRGVCADVFVRPNEGQRKIYFFPHSEKLTPIDQNTLLKVLEEPPEYAVFLLLSPNPGLLLPTVRSRCVELHLSPLPESLLLPALRTRFPDRDEKEYRRAAERGYLGQAIALMEQPALSEEAAVFLQAFAAKDALQMLEVLAPMERWKREQLLPTLQQWEGLLNQALTSRYGLPPALPELQKIRDRRTAREIFDAIESLRQAQVYCNANVGVAAVCSALAVKL